MIDNIRLIVVIPDSLKARLDRLKGNRKIKSFSRLIRELLERFIEEMEGKDK